MSIANLCVLHGYSNGEAWFEGGLGKALSWKGLPGQFLVWYGCGEVKTPTYETDTWGTLYDVVGSVKAHEECTSHGGSFFSSPRRIFSLSFISTKARFVNLAVDSGSTNHLFGLLVRRTMIHFSDAAIARGSKTPNQASDELTFIRVPPGLPCLRTSCA
jgi:hypothetical protein